MRPVILKNIPFKIDESKLFKRFNIGENDDLAEDVVAMINEASKLGKPKGIYNTVYIDKKDENSISAGGVTFISRVMRVNLENVHKFFPFVVTAGIELDEWAGSFSDGLKRYWADCIQEAALGSASAYLRSRIIEENSLSRAAVMNPGSLEDWPISEQPKLFSLLGDVKQAIGVELSESFLMLPIKSISGILFASETTYENCQLCPRNNCPGRRAPYDSSIYDRKYKKQEI